MLLINWRPFQGNMLKSYRTALICIFHHGLQKAVYKIYNQECTDQGIEGISKSHFLLMWRTSLSHVAIHKVSLKKLCEDSNQEIWSERT